MRTEVSTNRSSRLLAIAEKLTPLIVAIVAGIWFVYEYATFTGKQNAVSLEISKNQIERVRIEQEILKQQAGLGHFETNRKAAFQVENRQHLSVEPLFAEHRGAKRRRYLVRWEVSSINQGGREIEISNHEAEMFLGSEQTKARESGAVFEINHPPRPYHLETTGFLKWASGPRKDFKVGDLYGSPIGLMSPGDTRYAELSAVVIAEPGMWVFARSHIKLRDISNPKETDSADHWEYQRISGDSVTPPNKRLQGRPQAGTPEARR